ncbi:hypothetical protein GF318_04465 [Candidatus Micrarchaeota archaeon]|nr:hypothetical protein [Candidatus Micrarchaeota archaeon]
MADNNVIKRHEGRDKTPENAKKQRFWQKDTKFMRGLRVAQERAGKGLEHVPLTPQRGRMKRREQAGMTGAAVAEGITKGNQQLIDAMQNQKAEEAAPSAMEGSSPKGEGVAEGKFDTEFLREFTEAIRRGQSRTGGALGMTLTEVVTNELFIDAIRTKAVETPLEQVDAEYGERMLDIREDLADELASGQVKELNADRLDILLATMVGSKYVVTDSDELVYKRDSEGNIMTINNQPVPKETWDRDDEKIRIINEQEIVVRWPEDLPLPPDSFFRFVESLAQRKYSGEEGEFLGTLMKSFAEKRYTCPETNEETMKNLLDYRYVDDYLERKSSEPIDVAVQNFTGLLMDVLLTPTSQMHEELDAPGTGYFVEIEGFGPCRTSRAAEARSKYEQFGPVEQAKEKAEESVDEANQKLLKVANTTEALRAQFDQAKQEMETTNQKYQKILQLKQLAKQGKVDVPEDQLKKQKAAAEGELGEARENMNSAKQKLTRAESLLAQATAEKKQADRDYREKLTAYETHPLKNEVLAMRREEEENFSKVVRDTTDHFRAKIVEAREINEDLLDTLADRVEKWMDNLTITNLLKDVDELMRERSQLGGILMVQEAKDMPDDVKETANIARRVLRSRVDEFEKKLEEFSGSEEKDIRGKIKEADLPPAVERKFLDVAEAMRNMKLGNDFIEQHQVSELRKLRYPLRNAAKRAVEVLNERTVDNLGEITQAQFIIARMIWESSSMEVKPRVQGSEGRWRRFWNKVFWNFFTAESWIGKGRKRRQPGEPRGGKLLRMYRWAFKETVDDLFRFPTDSVVGRNPNTRKAHRYGWYKRFMRGIWKGALKAYLIVSIAAAVISSPPKDNLGWAEKYLLPWNWNWSHYISHFWRPPWEWHHSVDTPLSHRRIIDDSYDIPERLPMRADRYYEKAYGVSGEERLDWLRDHESALTYFQERTTLKKVSKVWDLGVDNVKTCARPKGVAASKSQQEENEKQAKASREGAQEISEGREEQVQEEKASEEPSEEQMSRRQRQIVRLMKRFGVAVPESCNDLGIREWPEGALDVMEYEPLTRTPGGGRDFSPDPGEKLDRWEPGYPFCCTIGLEWSPVEDGLMLNKHKTNEFIDYLQAQERNGAKIGLSYMDGHTRDWARKGYLISKQKRQVMSDFKIHDLDRVNFVIAQDSERIGKRLLQPIVEKEVEVAVPAPGEEAPDAGATAEREERTVRLKKAESIAPEARAAFLAEWERMIVSRNKEIEPLRERVDDSLLEETFEATVEKGRSEGWVIEMTEQHARQMLLKQFADFQLDESSAFILLSPDSQPIREYLSAFDREGAPYRLNPRLLNEFMEELQMHMDEGGDVQDYNPFTVPMGSRAQWAISAGYINEVEQFEAGGNQSRESGDASAQRELQEFWQAQSDTEFGIMVDTLIENLYADEGRAGNTVRSAFDGDRERTEAMMRSEIYRIVTGDNRRAERMRGDWTLQLREPEEEGGSRTVTIENPDSARRGINSYVLGRLARIQRARNSD